MENRSIDWKFFSYKFPGNETTEFERLAYAMFCVITDNRNGIFRFKNQKGIETIHVPFQGKECGFQAKFLTGKMSDSKSVFIDSISKSSSAYSKLDVIYFFCNQEFSQSTKLDESGSKLKSEIEEYAKNKNIEVRWILKSHFEIELLKPENHFIHDEFFRDKPPYPIWEILNKVEAYTKNILSFHSTFNNQKESIVRDETNTILDWVNSHPDEEKSNTAVLTARAGMGKTVIIKQVIERLQKGDSSTLVVGFKADQFNCKESRVLDSELSIPTNQTFAGFVNYMLQTNTYEKVVVLIDQIDALSQSLSSDRKSLDVYFNLVHTLTQISNVNIIISTRLYDLENDASLRALKNNKVFKVEELSDDIVYSVLIDNGYDKKKFSKKLISFLKVPLHLQLFLKANTNDATDYDSDTSLSSLYGKLWNNFISNSTLDTTALCALLKDISFQMYDNQELIVHLAKFYDCGKKQLIDYLESSGFLIRVSGDNYIQFIHQSLFDYTYARCFVNGGLLLTDELKQQHQGLFIRLRVKQILMYLRDTDSNRYLSEVRKVISGDDYRLHIKLLVVSLVASQSKPTSKEIQLSQKEITSNSHYLKWFLANISSVQWCEMLLNDSAFQPIFKDENHELRGYLNGFMWRLPLASAYQDVLEYYTSVQDTFGSVSNDLIETGLRNFDSQKILLAIDLFNKVHKENDYYRFQNFFSTVLKWDVDICIANTKKELTTYIEKLHKCHSLESDCEHPIKLLIEEIFTADKVKAIQLGIYLLNVCFKYDSIINTKPAIHSSSLFFDCSDSDTDTYKLHEVLFYEIRKALHSLRSKDELFSITTELLDSKYASLVALGVESCSNNLEKCDVLIDTVYNDNKYWFSESNLLNYYMGQLISRSHENIHPYVLCTIAYRLVTYSYEGYVTNTDGIKFRYLCLLPEEVISANHLVDYYFALCMQKYGERISFDRPIGVSCAWVGDPSLPDKQLEKFNDDNLILALKAIKPVSERRFMSNEPTITGVSSELKRLIEKDWEKYKTFIRKISCMNGLDLIYLDRSIDALMIAKADVGFISEILNNAIKLKGLSIDYKMGILRVIGNTLIGQVDLTRSLFDFIVKCTVHPDIERKDENVLYNAINELNGVAARLLMFCGQYTQYQGEIISNILSLSLNSRLSIKAIILDNLQLLLNIDRIKTFEIFLNLVKNMDVKLIALELSNTHALQYLIMDNFCSLKDYFKQATQIHEAAVPIGQVLYKAYIYQLDGAEQLFWDHFFRYDKKDLLPIFDWSLQSMEDHYKLSIPVINEFLTCGSSKAANSVARHVDYIRKLDEENQVNFFELYVHSSLAKYNTRGVCIYLEEFARDHPMIVIKWGLHLLTVKDYSKDPTIHNSTSEMNMMLSAYNAIRGYDVHDERLEEAMDMIDQAFLFNSELSTFLEKVSMVDG